LAGLRGNVPVEYRERQQRAGKRSCWQIQIRFGGFGHVPRSALRRLTNNQLAQKTRGVGVLKGHGFLAVP
jgi:hypothetical protein